MSQPVSFKRVFTYVSTMFLAIGVGIMVYTGVPFYGIADEPQMHPIEFPLQAVNAPAPELPHSFPSLMSYAEPVMVSKPLWPATMTAHDAASDPTSYLGWLNHQNPGMRFRAVHAIVTGYCPCPICCGRGAHGVTRTGVHTDAEPHGVAGPEALLRRGIHIPGYMFESEPGKIWKTDDTGSALNEDWDRNVYHFDVRFMSHDWAKRWWGRREMTVYLQLRSE